MRSIQCFGAAEVPQIANRNASASVDFPLPRAPIMQVRPPGMLTLKPGRNPPLISIFSTSHIRPTSTAREALAVFYQHLESFSQCRIVRSKLSLHPASILCWRRSEREPVPVLGGLEGNY